MDTAMRQELIKVQTEAAAVLDAGQKLASRAAARPMTGRDRSRLCTEALGGALDNPAEFWAGACVVESGVEIAEAQALTLSIKYAAARMRVNDFSFVAESLVGQAQWASSSFHQSSY